MSDNQPDFDNMTPEEIMAWMETLAKRQGASEGFTTAADMNIAEIDPDTVVIDEPGYVPYGQERSQPAEPPTPARPAAPPTPPPAPVPQRPATSSVPTMLTNPAPQRPPEPAKADPPVDEGALAWLESLAADQGDGLFNLDLSGLSDEMEDAPAAQTQPINPMNWLEDLARAQSPAPSLEQFEREAEGDEYDEEVSEKLDPYGEGVNPMEWLETLALRQGAKQEELTTPARMNIPAPEDTEVEDDDYQPFSFDTLPTRRAPEPAALENPADWLSSLADGQGYSEEGVRATQPDNDDMSMASIQDAITQGTVTSEQMQYFLDRQADELANLPPEDDLYDEDDDGSLIAPAELPDWLSDLKPQASAPEPSKSIDALFETPAASEMPDWLKQDVLGSDIDADLERIFEPEDEPSRPLEPAVAAALAADILIDQNDPWVEALDEEYEQGGMANIDDVPEWYEQNLRDEQRIAVIEGRTDEEGEEDTTLVEAALPEESNLSAGQPQAIPDWLGGTEPVMADEEDEFNAPAAAAAVAVAAAEPAVFEEMPDWLKEVESAVSPQDVPDWLVESISIEDEPVAEEIAAPVNEIFVEPEPPAVILAPVPKPTPVTAAAPAPTSTGQSAQVLEGARDKEQSGDLEGALADYEGLIRASVDLEAVVADLTQLVKSYKTTPAVYRVLGDGLMRQGKLQAALNTYREALNQL